MGTSVRVATDDVCRPTRVTRSERLITATLGRRSVASRGSWRRQRALPRERGGGGLIRPGLARVRRGPRSRASRRQTRPVDSSTPRCFTRRGSRVRPRLRRGPRRARDALHPVRPCGRWREVVVEGGRVRLPSGAGLDLGGLVKGWTADPPRHAPSTRAAVGPGERGRRPARRGPSSPHLRHGRGPGRPSRPGLGAAVRRSGRDRHVLYPREGVGRTSHHSGIDPRTEHR